MRSVLRIVIFKKSWKREKPGTILNRFWWL